MKLVKKMWGQQQSINNVKIKLLENMWWLQVL